MHCLILWKYLFLYLAMCSVTNLFCACCGPISPGLGRHDGNNMTHLCVFPRWTLFGLATQWILWIAFFEYVDTGPDEYGTVQKVQVSTCLHETVLNLVPCDLVWFATLFKEELRKMQRKAGFSRLSVVKELENTKIESCNATSMKKSVSVPLLKFQNLVSTITMTRSFALRHRNQLRKENTSEDAGEFYMSHATSPDDNDRRPDTTMTGPTTIRSDVLSRLNMSDHFRFITTPNKKFQERKVCNTIKEVLEERLQGCTYSAEFCQEMSPVLADAIKERVKRLVFPRYKIICHVIMGQLNGQSMRSVSRCAWNEEFDNFAQYCFQTPTLCAIGVVYGIYAE